MLSKVRQEGEKECAVLSRRGPCGRSGSPDGGGGGGGGDGGGRWRRFQLG